MFGLKHYDYALFNSPDHTRKLWIAKGKAIIALHLGFPPMQVTNIQTGWRMLRMAPIEGRQVLYPVALVMIDDTDLPRLMNLTYQDTAVALQRLGVFAEGSDGAGAVKVN